MFLLTLFSWFFALSSLIEAKEYVIRYQTLTSGTLYHVETREGEKIGKVVREKNKSDILYSFLDPTDQLLAKGTAERRLPDTRIRLVNKEGATIGGFSAEIYNLYPTEYKVFSKEDHLIAKGFMNWLGNTFTLADPNHPKHFIVTFFRPMFKLFNDNWHFDIHEEGPIDLGILSVLGAFQTACDLSFEMQAVP